MGEWGRFRDPGLMRTRQYGDLKFYKDNYLSEMDAPAFNNMSRDAQLAVATFASVYPDVQIRFVQKGKHGESGAHWVQEGESFVEINTDSPFALEAIMAHEITHHLEVHGMRDTVHELLLGNHYTGKKGVFTALDEDGKRLFVKANMTELMRLVDPDVIAAVCTAMSADDDMTDEDLEKN